MKTKPSTEAFTSIETAALTNVTGGCAACGQNCGRGPAPQNGPKPVTPQDANPFAQR